MDDYGDQNTTVVFVRPSRLPPPTVNTAEINVVAPPQPPRPAGGSALARLLPVVMTAAMVPMMAVGYRSGSAMARSPVFLVFPLLMVGCTVATAVVGRGRRHGNDLDADRHDYLDYLAGLRDSVVKTAAAQQLSLAWRHPAPAALWTLVGGPRMWERQPEHPDFGQIRVAVGPVQLATRLVPPPTGQAALADPVTTTALRRFLETHSAIPDAPIAVTALGMTAVTLDGDPSSARGLLRAMICQLAVLHGPDSVLITAVVADRTRKHWEWLKWLPHHMHPAAVDDAGPARLGYPNLAAAEAALATLPAGRRAVVVLDGGAVTGTEQIIADPGTAGVTVFEIGSSCADLAAGGGQQLMVSTAALAVRSGQQEEVLGHPDQLDPIDALVCSRRLAGYRIGGSASGGRPTWTALLGVEDITRVDLNVQWRNVGRRDRLRVPIGTAASGAAVQLDIKEPAEGGMGPHGLCIGATGSGKSELLRTIALGMMVRHPPETLNLVLVDFKGGATFLGMERANQVAAVITNLADQAPLVARMRDALLGELHRRQELLRSAGNFDSAAAYQRARRAGAALTPLPALLVIVDEFAELLSQHPDFVDIFVAIGRLGRSLGVHLLLASQRLEEGRLRGLESHLSYRVCLKTLSASESRVVLGTPDAYLLPSVPGLGYLRAGPDEAVRFQTAFVSGECPEPVSALPGDGAPPTPRLFTAAPNGPVRPARLMAATAQGGRTVMAAVLDQLAGRGAPARQVWLPPLDVSPTLRSLLQAGPEGDLVVPIGIVDRPFEQSRTRLTVDLRGGAGHLAIVGAPQSGKSTTLATLITALAATHDPARVQLYCLDFGGGALAALRALPQVGSVAARTEPELVRRTVSELESILSRRETLFRDHGIGSMTEYRRLRASGDPVCAADRFGDVFLVIDGWAALSTEFDALEASILALAGRGLSFGLHLALSASRWAEIRPGLRDQIGTRIELRLGDPADSELDRRRAAQVPRDKPGRGLTDDGLHMLIALPGPAGVEPVRSGHRTAPPVPLLPTMLRWQALLELLGDAGTQPLLGIAEAGLDAVTVDFSRQPHLLIFGDNECGKTSALRLLCRELMRTHTAAQAQLIVVDYRRSLLGVVEPEHLGGYAMSTTTLTAVLPALLDQLARRMPGPEVTQQQLRDRSWWAGPQFYLLVDDYDLVATAAGNPLSPLLEYLPHADDLGLHLVVARRSGGAARAVYEPLLAALRDLGCMGLTLSGDPDEGPLIGSVRPVPLPPGRGTLITRAGGAQLIQLAWTSPP